MLREPILSIGRNGTPHQGAATTFLVIFESRGRAILKPFGGQNPNACAYYDQDVDECLTHEAVAWRLAHSLGEPFDQLLPIAVLRDVPGAGPGVLINWREGSPDPRVFHDAQAQVHAGAFWDALIGQQDRHLTNFRYDAPSRRLALIDSAFAFARPGDFVNGASVFLEHRHAQAASDLTPHERTAVDRLLDNELFGLGDFLAPDRAAAFYERSRRMRESGVLPRSGEF
jgi:hypothetical protein